MSSNKEFLIRVKADIDEAVADFKKLSSSTSDSMEGIASSTEKPVKAMKTWHQFIKGKMGPLMKKFAAEGKSHADAHTAAIRQIAAEWKAYKKTGVNANKTVGNAAEKSGRQTKNSARGINVASKAIKRLGVAAAAYISIRLAIRLIKQADAFNVLQARIKNATRETGDYNKVQKQLLTLSNNNGAALQETVDVFQRLTLARQDLGATNNQLVELTDLVQKLGVVSGASKTALKSGLLQFGQGLSSGIFRAEEFNSILENMPAVAQKIAKGLGKSPGELRKMVLEGKLLSRDVMQAILGQADEIKTEFSEIPLSIERSSTSLSNSFSKFLGQLDKASGLTTFIAKNIQDLSNALSGTPEKMELLVARLEQIESRKVTSRGGRSNSRGNLNRLIDDAKRDIDDALIALGGPVGLRVAVDRVDKQIESLEYRLSNRRTGTGRGRRGLSLLKQQITELEGQRDKLLTDLAEDELSTGDTNKEKKISQAEITRLNNIQKIVKALESEAATVGMTKNEITLYKLELLGASSEQIKMAETSIKNTDAIKAQNKLMAEGRKVIANNRTEMDNLAITLEKLDSLYEKGALGVVGSAAALDQYAKAVFNATDKLDDFKDSGKETFKELIAATKGWGNQFSNTLADMVVDGKGSFKDLANAIIKDILRILIYQNLVKPVLGSFGLLPSAKASVNHSGGIAGSSSGVTRNVSPFAFAGAQRFHNGGFPGLRSNEVPTILEKGEEVLTRNDPRNALNKGDPSSVKVELVNKGTPSEATSATTRFDGSDMVVSIVLEDLDRNGRISSALDNKYRK